jgi:hypothetical protein
VTPLYAITILQIAHVSPISQILEKNESIKLTNHLELNRLIYEHQYGLLRNKSTEHNLLHVINNISTALNENKYYIAIFLDLKKVLIPVTIKYSLVNQIN